MESAKSGHRTVSGHRRNPTDPTEAVDGQIARTDPRSRALNRSSRADRYASFADEVLRELNPRGPLEQLAVDHVVHSAWKLKANLETQGARDRSEPSDPDAGPSKARIRPTELDRAARSMREALEALDFLRARSRPTPEVRVDPLGLDESDFLSNEWPVLPCSDGLDDRPGIPDGLQDDDADKAPNWQGRLVFDFEVSDVSPVIKGTWVTVAHVVSLIVDGWAWSDILRSHPELTEEDIRTCVAYAMAEENSAA
jgi:uncharacterized protein (DUF433 family)